MAKSVNPNILRHEADFVLKSNENEMIVSDVFVSTRYIFDFDSKKFPWWFKINEGVSQLFDYHYHNYIEIIILHKGSINVVADFGKFKLNEGEILVVNADEVHAGFGYDPDISMIDYTVIKINVETLYNMQTSHEVKELLSGLMMRRTKIKNHIKTTTYGYEIISSTINRIVESYEDKDRRDVLLLQLGWAMQILGEIEYYGLINKVKDDFSIKGKDFAKEVLYYIRTNYKKKITTKTASKNFSYEESQFCRLFKKHFNTTFIEFLNSYRIKMACCYDAKDESIVMEDIAKDVGFDNYSYFWRTFKKHTGKSPKEFFCVDNDIVIQDGELGN